MMFSGPNCTSAGNILSIPTGCGYYPEQGGLINEPFIFWRESHGSYP